MKELIEQKIDDLETLRKVYRKTMEMLDESNEENKRMIEGIKKLRLMQSYTIMHLKDILEQGGEL